MFKFYLIGVVVAFCLSLYAEIKTARKATLSGALAVLIASLLSWLSVILGIAAAFLKKQLNEYIKEHERD